jgi:acetyl esterase
MQLIIDPIVWIWRKLFARLIAIVGAIFSVIMRLDPTWWPWRHGIRVHRGLVYATHDGKSVKLDVYCPKNTSTAKPVVLYIHGGGFGLFSRTSHWFAGVRFAAAGFVVCNIDYRLAPKNPYPAAHEDACDAYVWILNHISDYGGDPSRVVVAGESAGANLAMAVVLASCFRGEEPWAQRVFDAQYHPKVGVSISGLLQVSDH